MRRYGIRLRAATQEEKEPRRKGATQLRRMVGLRIGSVEQAGKRDNGERGLCIGVLKHKALGCQRGQMRRR